MSHAPAHTIKCRIQSCDAFTDTIFALKIAAEDGRLFNHQAGQYAVLSLPGDTSHDPRPYSIASMPDRDILEFHIKDMNRGLSHALARSPVGTEVFIEYPLGDAVYRPSDRPIIAVGGGLGLAPLLPVISSALKRNPDHAIHLYHGVADRLDLYLSKQLEQLAQNHPHFVFTGVIENLHGTAAMTAADHHDDLSGYDAYLSGAPAMVIATFKALEDKGLDIKNTISDALSGKIKDFA